MNLPQNANTNSYTAKSPVSSEEQTPSAVSLHSLGKRRPQRVRWPLLSMFFLGIVVGIVFLSFLFLVVSPDRAVISSPSFPSSGAVTVTISRDYMTQVITKQLKTSGLPGNVSNIQVTLSSNNLVIVSGDDQLSVLGFEVTKHFTMTSQLNIAACQLHATIIHADLAGIPVTGFVAAFENQINQQIQLRQSILPAGFAYCMTGVQTLSNQVVIVVSATPVS